MLGSRVVTAQPNMSLTDAREFPIPLPPLAEQRCIVAKVDALMALCDRLGKRAALPPRPAAACSTPCSPRRLRPQSNPRWKQPSDGASERGAIVSVVAEAAGKRIARKTIHALQKMTDRLSGEDSGLANVWDEICVQVQDEESVFWNVYEDIARKAVEEFTSKIAEYEKHALWFQTTAGEDWLSEEPEDRDPAPFSEFSSTLSSTSLPNMSILRRPIGRTGALRPIWNVNTIEARAAAREARNPSPLGEGQGVRGPVRRGDAHGGQRLEFARLLRNQPNRRRGISGDPCAARAFTGRSSGAGSVRPIRGRFHLPRGQARRRPPDCDPGGRQAA